VPEESDVIIREIENLAFLPGGEGERTCGGKLVVLKKILRLKIAYELSAGRDAPLAGICAGGTNVGKSTLFNALLGAEVVVPDEKAGTTKFPVASLPESGYEPLLGQDFLPAYGRERLAGDLPETRMRAPGELRHFFYIFRDGGRLPGLALFDAPDIDSVASRLVAGDKTSFLLAEDLMVASDVVLFVTTPEKYNVQRCMDFLVLALHLGKTIYVFLNKLDKPDSNIPEHFLKELVNESGLVKDRMPEIVGIPRAGSESSPAQAVADSLDEFAGTFDNLLKKRAEFRRKALGGAARHALRLQEEVFDTLAREAKLAAKLRAELDEVRHREISTYLDNVEKQTAYRFDEVVRDVMEHFSLARKKWMPAPVRWVIHLPRKLGRGISKTAGRLFGYGSSETADEKAAVEIRKRLASLRQEVASLIRKGSEAGSPVHSAVYSRAITEEFFGRDFGAELERRLDEIFAPIHNWEKSVREDLISRVARSKTVQTLIQSVDALSIMAGVVAAWMTGGFTPADLAIGPGSAIVVQKLLESLGGKAYFGRKWKELLEAHKNCFAQAADEMVFNEVVSAFPPVPEAKALGGLQEKLVRFLKKLQG
jgi:hypothetical protein